MNNSFNTGDPVLFDPLGGSFLATKGIVKNRVSVCGFQFPQYRIENEQGQLFSVAENKMCHNPTQEKAFCQESRLWASQLDNDFQRRYVVVFIEHNKTLFTLHETYQEAQQTAQETALFPPQSIPIYIALAYIAKACIGNNTSTTCIRVEPHGSQDIRFVWHTVLNVSKDIQFRQQQQQQANKQST